MTVTPTRTTMTAVVQHGYGIGPGVLRTEEAPVPMPRPGEVLVRVEAAGVSRGVWHLSTGRPVVMRLATGLRSPRQPFPGADLSGTVVALGEGVTGFTVGQPVLGRGRGAFATYAVAKAKSLVLRPEGLGPEEAAALPDSGTTARQAVLRHARVRAGERVLVIGASGGVGSYAVQLAAAAGAEVTGVASRSKHAAVLGLGAVDVIDYRVEEVDARGPRYDVIIDIAGYRSLGVLRRALAPRGRLLIIGAETGGPLGGLTRQWRARLVGPFVRHRMGGMLSMANRDDLLALTQAAASGALRPVVSRRYSLADAGQALRDLEAGTITGKAVVVP
jgi:NADPH:quinone reductase-like Zn-dependent oxidoreductase